MGWSQCGGQGVLGAALAQGSWWHASSVSLSEDGRGGPGVPGSIRVCGKDSLPGARSYGCLCVWVDGGMAEQDRAGWLGPDWQRAGVSSAPGWVRAPGSGAGTAGAGGAPAGRGGEMKMRMRMR